MDDTPSTHRPSEIGVGGSDERRAALWWALEESGRLARPVEAVTTRHEDARGNAVPALAAGEPLMPGPLP
jgi:hypothetical protein